MELFAYGRTWTGTDTLWRPCIGEYLASHVSNFQVLSKKDGAIWWRHVRHLGLFVGPACMYRAFFASQRFATAAQG